MAKKISQLESAVDVTANDLIQVIDVEDGDMAPSGTNKKATASLLANQLVPLINSNSIDGSKIQDGTITSAKIADGTIVNSDINASAAIDASKIANITATGSTTARSLANRFADVMNVKDFGAVGDGVTNDSGAFQAAGVIAKTIFVPSGNYVLNSDVENESTYIFDSYAQTSGSGVLLANVNRPNSASYPSRRKNLGDVLKKADSGSPITVAFYGTSITYGQDTSATGQNTQINGASQKRSPTPYPEEFAEAASFAGFSGGVTVYNRGFPGDSTIEGISRWKSASSTDISFIEYGHNDAMNYGGYPHGPVPVEEYRKNLSIIIEREIVKGAAVIVLGSTPVNGIVQNETIRCYVVAAKSVADQYGIPFIDCEEIINSINTKWTDNVHLSPSAYNEIGWNLAGLLFRRDAAIRTVTNGDVFYASDFLGHGGSLHTWSGSKSGVNSVIRLTSGQAYAFGVYCNSVSEPVVTTVNPDGSSFTVNSYYSGSSYIQQSGLTHDLTYGIRQSFPTQTLARGFRTIIIRNDGTNPAYIESIEFTSNNNGTTTRGIVSKSEFMSGVFPPARVASVQASWFAAADTSKRLTSPCNIITHIKLDSLLTNGVGLFKEKPRNLFSEFISGDSLLALKSGTTLVLRQLQGGAVLSDTTFASAFPVGDFIGEIESSLDSGVWSVYINGTLAGSVSGVSQTYGYAGVIGNKNAKFVCYGMYTVGGVKSIYL